MKKNAYQQGAGVALKVAIVSLAAFYIVRRFSTQPDPGRIIGQVADSFANHPLRFCLVLLLMPVNWLLETWKWKTLVAQRLPITFKDALKGVLAGVTTGTATPNRVGEFAGRVFMTKDGDRVELMLFSFLASICQVVVTVLAGLWALIGYPAIDELGASISKYERYYLWAIVPALIGATFFVDFLPRHLREKFTGVMRTPALVFLKVLGLSAVRYAVYVLQFVLLLSIVAPELSWTMAAGHVAVCYLLVTVLPTFSLTEMLMRGSVAGVVFAGVPHLSDTAFYVAIVLWCINVAVPALVGSVFVFRLKFFRSSAP